MKQRKISQAMEDQMERSLAAFKKRMDEMSPEEFKKLEEECFPEDKTPKGWVSIEDQLPGWMMDDVEQGYSVYKVKNAAGEEFESRVTDHDAWYYRAKEAGITHWWND
jgi:hypothetical protein